MFSFCTCLNCKASHDENPIYDVDIAIIGAGISGLYLAYTLVHEHGYKGKIAIYDSNKHLGGRILTRSHNKFNMEFGPVRFTTNAQIKLAKLMIDFGIDASIFPNYEFPNDCPDLSKCSVEEVIYINNAKKVLKPNIPLAIIKYTIAKIVDVQWDIVGTNRFDRGREAQQQLIRKFGLYNGIPLYQWGMYDICKEVLSEEALRFLVTRGMFFSFIRYNPNAADYICTLLDLFSSDGASFYTIPHGCSTIIDKMSEHIRDKVPIHLMHTLKRIHEYHSNTPGYCNAPGHCNAPGIYALTFTNTQNDTYKIVTAKRVVLATNLGALNKIEGIPQKIRILTKNIFTVGLFKIFTIVKHPPWRDINLDSINNRNTWVANCLEMYYWYDKDSDEGLLLIFGDQICMNYWQQFLVLYETCDNANNNILENEISRIITEIFRCPIDWNIVKIMVKSWANASGMAFWKPHVCSVDSVKLLRNFSLSPCGTKRMHICGDNFSQCQCFIEGALISASHVADTIINDTECS
jgi:Flavin containing amine oxidoreductase